MRNEEKLNYVNGRYSANEAIDNFILGYKAREYKHLYLKDEAVPYCSKAEKIIASPAFSNFINKDADRIVRGKNEHEAGHAKFTPCDKNPKWSNTKGNLINVLEDLRIERGVSSLSEAFKGDLNFLNDYLIKRINDNFVSGKCANCKPITEAITALHIDNNENSKHAWILSEKAQKYYDVAKDIFVEWKEADYLSENGFAKIEEIADRILQKWEEVKEQEEEMKNSNSSNNNKNEKEENKQDEQESGNSSSNGEENEEKQNSNESNDESDGNSSDESNSYGDESDDCEENENSNSSSDDYDESNSSENEKSNGKQESNSSESSNKDDDFAKDHHSNKHGKGDTNIGNNLDDDCDKESIMDEVLENELKEMIEESKKELGDYTALTKDDAIIRAKEDVSMYEKSRSEIAGAISAMTGYMEQSLKTLSKNRKVGNMDRGKFDMRSLPMLAKNLKKDVFYTEKHGISLDTTISILLDESGSIGETCYEFQKMAIAFSEVFERLGIKFEILGHTTGYNNVVSKEELKLNRITPMIIYEHKNFNESYRKEKYRLGSITYRNCNIDGEALLYTFKRNQSQKAKRHIIMVLSDGEPSGTRDRNVGRNHLKKVVEFCRKNKTEVYAFGIGTRTPKSFYGENNFVYIGSSKEINSAFFKQLSNIIINGNMTHK